MRYKIPCFCDNSFTVDVPDKIYLDKEPRYIEDIIAGNFMSFVCESCGKKHKPEFPVCVYWPEKGLSLEVIPELDRGDFYRKKDGRKSSRVAVETVIGYPELAERIAVVRDDLVPEAEEALKYYLLIKADETYPEDDISIWYQGRRGDSLEFHIHGIRQDEVAVIKAPLALYEKTLGDYRKNPRSDPFASLRVKTYLSIQNMLRPEELK
jgi:hypothetical protein